MFYARPARVLIQFTCTVSSKPVCIDSYSIAIVTVWVSQSASSNCSENLLEFWFFILIQGCVYGTVDEMKIAMAFLSEYVLNITVEPL